MNVQDSIINYCFSTTIVIIFNGIDNGLSEIKILKDVFGVGLYGNNIDNEILFGMF